MANKLDPMDLKQILTLHLEGYSNRKIGSVLGISRNTVNTYMQLFAGSDYSFQELLGFDTPALSELFSSHTTLDPVRHNELMLYFEGVNKARNHHVLAVIERISKEEIPPIKLLSDRYFQIYDGKKYPPKYIISIAHEVEFGFPLGPLPGVSFENEYRNCYKYIK
ncbi:sigma factor-like helix-turn-helix DNA-binding protein [Pedobacter sp. FW305-3-2-15-E-R2A2]|uniref:sigma factor-like helix-turn-helix DNA-binding protein n=1 Tax=Pedobacter sp. FW305-3-2-15-E-R2A2 TaxID=3140251 RepID=UPI003140A919